MTLDWTTAEFADGAKVAEWLHERVTVTHWGDTIARQVARWRGGVTPEFWTVDRVLTEMGYHPMDLPQSCWVERPRPKPKPKRNRPRQTRLSVEDVLAIRSEARSATRGELAKRYGVSVKTISNVANGWTHADVGKKRVAA